MHTTRSAARTPDEAPCLARHRAIAAPHGDMSRAATPLAHGDDRGRGASYERAVPRGSGIPAPQALHALGNGFLAERFGRDLSGVRIHQGADAADTAARLGATAFTIGSDVVLGTPDPGSRILAHELAHAMQQSHASLSAGPLRISAPSDAAEREADRIAASALAGETLPVATHHEAHVARQPDPQAVCWQPGHEDDAPGADDCSPRRPDLCATYGQWIATFSLLRTFRARDTAPGGRSTTGFDVLGGGAASHDESADAGNRAAPAIGEGRTDHFIDHPTDSWVRTCLPDNLREDAYRLPADCADIAVVLRHVWLSAHHRTERFGTWTIGDRAGGAARDRIATVIGEVFTGNVAAMVSPYADGAGRPLRTFAALAPLLHEGDVLVWEHHDALGGRRTGGHTQTITRVVRDDAGNVTRLDVVQGNQPISEPQATEITAAETAQHRDVPSVETMRNWPGRRIESERLTSAELQDVIIPAPHGAHAGTAGTPVWSDDGTTTLVVAGPPHAAARPAAHAEHGVPVRRVTDWRAALRGARAAAFAGTLEAALGELRAAVEAQAAVSDDDADAVGIAAGTGAWAHSSTPGTAAAANAAALAGALVVVRAFGHVGSSRAAELQRIFDRVALALARGAGERLWADAHAAGGRGEDEHFRPLTAGVDAIRTLPFDASFRGTVERAFEDAARGGTTLDFTRRRARAGVTDLKMLVTGFDPFESTGSLAAPARGEWNPSGAAAMALDGSTVEGPGPVRTAVEGVVLPVSFTEFTSGVVERLVPAAQVDAVVTVSLEPNLQPSDPVRLERFAVGVHTAENDTVERTPAAPGGAQAPLILPSTAPIDDIARDAAHPARRGLPAVPMPTTGDQVVFRFDSLGEESAALTALGLTPRTAAQRTSHPDVSIAGPALSTILATMRPDPLSLTAILFDAGGAGHRAQVRASAGGNFLSNEVSYRVLRQLSQQPNAADRMSFHVHTPGSGPIPQDTSTPAARTAQRTAIGDAAALRGRLIETLRSVIRATAGRLITRRRTP